MKIRSWNKANDNTHLTTATVFLQGFLLLKKQM